MKTRSMFLPFLRATAFTFILLLLIGFGTPCFAQSARWLTDFEKAQAQAKTENKMLLLDFTGSDWCGWCMKMDKETLSQKDFKEFAAKNLVLVEVDFPQGKRQTKKVKEQNEGLKAKYKVSGYPTFLVLDEEGNELGRQSGYLEGGPSAFIAKIESFKK